jgi:hypothetical protein
MARTEVTLKLSPLELQIIYDALMVWTATIRDRAGEPKPNDQLAPTIFGGDWRFCVVAASQILKDLGLQTMW